MRFKFFCLLIYLLSSDCSLFAQPCGPNAPVFGITNEGTEFFLGMLYPSYNEVMPVSLDKYFKVYAFITTYYDNHIIVSYYDSTGEEVNSLPYNIPARQTAKILLDISSLKMSSSEEKAAFKSCHIVSKRPVTVQYLSVGACSGGSYLALPVPGLGKKYVAASYNDNPGVGAYINPSIGINSAENSAGEFEIIATENNTSVTIIPKVKTIGGHEANQPFAINLDRGECYLVRSDGNDDNSDISGSIVETSKPVAVISGHENANLGGVGEHDLDSRDFMIEQMVPVELWDSTGFTSIPMKHGDPQADEGSGNNFRIYCFDSLWTQIEVNGGVDITASNLSEPIPELFDQTEPVNIGTADGKKISVMQYDQRSQPDNPPFSAPSMMTVIPKSRWKNFYNLYVPGNEPFASAQDYYVNIIGGYPESILVSMNGSAYRSLGSFVSAGRSDLVGGYRYKIQPGSYVFESSQPFMLYSYGMRAVSLGSQIDANAGNSFFFEYALPGGMELYTGVQPMLDVSIDTGCRSWHVCVKDLNPNPGIREIILIDDTDAIYFSSRSFGKGRKFYNVNFDPNTDIFSNDDIQPKIYDSSEYCFDVHITDPSKSAYAPIAIIDNGGNATLVDLYYDQNSLEISTLPHAAQEAKHIILPSTKIGESICTTFVLKNTLRTIGSPPVKITSAKLAESGTGYSLTFSRQLPKYLYSINEYYLYDSLEITVCHTPQDVLQHSDTLVVSTECYDISITLESRGMTGLIQSSDIDFGSVKAGGEISRPIIVRNIGEEPVEIINYYLPNERFALDDASIKKLPAILKPNQSTTFSIIYHPSNAGMDTTRIIWNTGLDQKIESQGKNYSILKGMVTNSLRVEDSRSADKIAIFPSPASGSFIIISFPPQDQNERLSIYDMLGREVYKREISLGTSEIEIALQNFSEGIYYVKLNNLTGSFVKLK